MTEKKYEFGLKDDPKDLFDILKAKADEKGWNLDGNAQQGTFSDSWSVVSGAYQVRGRTVYVTVECGVASLWPRIDRELPDFFE